MIDPKEEVCISFQALFKIATNALLFSESITTFRMVMGMLGGMVDGNNHHIYKALSTSIGSSTNVNSEAIGYADMARFSQALRSENMFVMGWYVSMPPDGFYNTLNRDFHSVWQKMYKKSFILVFYPQYFIEGNYNNFIECLRLKDVKSSDSTRGNWQSMRIEMLDLDYDSSIEKLTSKWIELKDILSFKNKELLINYFDKNNLFNFEEKDQILTELRLNTNIDEELHSLYFTKEEFRMLYKLTRAHDPTFWKFDDLSTREKLRKEANDILNEIPLTKHEMRLLESLIQGDKPDRSDYRDLSYNEKLRYDEILGDIIVKLRAGYSKK